MDQMSWIRYKCSAVGRKTRMRLGSDVVEALLDVGDAKVEDLCERVALWHREESKDLLHDPSTLIGLEEKLSVRRTIENN